MFPAYSFLYERRKNNGFYEVTRCQDERVSRVQSYDAQGKLFKQDNIISIAIILRCSFVF